MREQSRPCEPRKCERCDVCNVVRSACKGVARAKRGACTLGTGVVKTRLERLRVDELGGHVGAGGYEVRAVRGEADVVDLPAVHLLLLLHLTRLHTKRHTVGTACVLRGGQKCAEG